MGNSPVKLKHVSSRWWVRLLVAVLAVRALRWMNGVLARQTPSLKQLGQEPNSESGPIVHDEVIEAKQREWFEGSREWLFEEVRQWLRSGKRLCWLVGAAGTGKSVVSARLLLTEGVREHVKAWHFCRHDNAAGSDVSVILQSWSAMLANNMKGFKASTVIDTKALSAREMFKLLIADPLACMRSRSPCVIVLDALDELPRGSLKDVLQLLAEEFDKLPSCVRLFVTSRDEALISKHLVRFEKVKLEVEEVRNRADLRLYLAQVARRHVTLELGMADLETRMEREFKLAPFCLRSGLRGLDEAMGRCKDIYAAAFAKVQISADYRAICRICEFKLDMWSKQCSGDLDQLFVDAQEAHKRLKRVLFTNKQLVDDVIDPGLKSRDSALRKKNTEYKGDASHLKDLVRFTALFSSCQKMKVFVERLCKLPEKGVPWMWPGAAVVALKNKYSSPSVLGHRDLTLTLGVKLSSGRVHLCELQVNLVDMMTAARLTHVFYEEVRVQVPQVCEHAGIKDVELFKAKLSKMLRSSAMEAAVNELERKAEGLFLYASLLARHLETLEHKVDFAALQGLPSGLSEIYEMNFARIIVHMSNEGEQEAKEQWVALSRLISLIIAAREPLPVTLAREILGAGYEEMEQALSLLVPVRQSRFQVLHKSVVDWLQDSERKSLFAISNEDIQAAHRSMGQCFHRHCLCQSANEFCLRHVVYHLCMAGLWDEVYVVVSSVEGWLLPRAQIDPLGMVVDLELAASFDCSPHRSTIRLMGQALDMDLDEIRQDHRTLAGRLVGRLMGHESKEVQELLGEVRKWPGPPEGWWCPMQPTLVPAGGPLVTMFHLPFPSWGRAQWNPGNTDQMAILAWDEVWLYEASRRQCLRALTGHSDEVTSVSWSSDGSRICSGSRDNTLRVWDVSSEECIHTFEGHSSCVKSVSWSSDGSRICSGSEDKTVRVWDVSNGECFSILEGHFDIVTSVACSDGSRICSGSADKTVRVWDVSNGECLHVLEGHSREVTSVACGDNGRICSGSYDRTVRVWDVSSGQCLHTLQHLYPALSVCWSSDNSRICSGGWCIILVWDVSSGQCIHNLEGHSGFVFSVSWSSNGRICSGGWDDTVRVWDVVSAERVQALDTSPGFSDVFWSNANAKICSVGGDGTARLWDMTTANIQTLEGNPSFLGASVSWSSDDSRICSGSRDNTVLVWDVASGQCIHTLEGHSSIVTSVSWSSDGRICSGSGDNTIRVWDVSSGECLSILEGHFDMVESVAWSSDNGRICSGSYDKTVRVWDVSSGQCLHILEGHSFGVASVAWSGDNGRICSRSDETVRVWDVSSGRCLHTLRHSVTSMSWRSDGKISLGYRDRTVRMWSCKCAGGACWGHNCLEIRGYLPIGFVDGLSVCQTNPSWAVCIKDCVMHWLCRLGQALDVERCGLSRPEENRIREDVNHVAAGTS